MKRATGLITLHCTRVPRVAGQPRPQRSLRPIPLGGQLRRVQVPQAPSLPIRTPGQCELSRCQSRTVAVSLLRSPNCGFWLEFSRRRNMAHVRPTLGTWAPDFPMHSSPQMLLGLPCGFTTAAQAHIARVVSPRHRTHTEATQGEICVEVAILAAAAPDDSSIHADGAIIVRAQIGARTGRCAAERKGVPLPLDCDSVEIVMPALSDSDDDDAAPMVARLTSTKRAITAGDRGSAIPLSRVFRRTDDHHASCGRVAANMNSELCRHRVCDSVAIPWAAVSTAPHTIYRGCFTLRVQVTFPGSGDPSSSSQTLDFEVNFGRALSAIQVARCAPYRCVKVAAVHVPRTLDGFVTIGDVSADRSLTPDSLAGANVALETLAADAAAAKQRTASTLLAAACLADASAAFGDAVPLRDRARLLRSAAVRLATATHIQRTASVGVTARTMSQ